VTRATRPEGYSVHNGGRDMDRGVVSILGSHERQSKRENLKDAHEAALVLSYKWVLAVLLQLAAGPRCHNELARATGLTENKPLDRALRRMVSMQLVDRSIHNVDGSAPRVRYSLTAKGHSVLPIIDELATWWQTPETNDRYPVTSVAHR
jgi:DNA-binding HxlR family transcriptional regulator